MNPAHEKRVQIKGVVFDLDDTLYPQAAYKRAGFRAVAQWLEEQEGIEPTRTYAKLEGILQNRGASYPCMFDDLCHDWRLSPGLVKQLIEVFIAHQPELEPYPGVARMLEKLRPSYRLGILTDGRQSSQEKKLAALQLPSKVDTILCSDSLNLEKPSVELYQWFEEQFQLSGSQLVYIGDNPNKDFLGARQRNWLTIRVRTGEHSNLQVSCKLQADHELAKVTDLFDWLNQNNQN